ncbi:MAG TPA: polynucleotide adenylyltransferase [Verrucomicrobiota bacterium]|nr:polynucleotide adenylyltransferase [Verrucomicrobiota bacterium]HNU51706.1 polynucleotide adenylyltransferase [Verrucomicrobiota bacterium]
MSAWIPAELTELLAGTPALRRAYLVGGCVRDALLGLPVNDFDVEVFGLSYEQLAHALRPWGHAELVGRAFGVLKFRTRRGLQVDFSIPRRDAKVAPGHKGFAVELNPEISLAEAAARRDFTLNALLYDPRQDQILDFHGGAADLERRVLRHTSPAFSEDPLRVLRGMQFIARFDLRPALETVTLCRQIVDAYGELAIERVRDEWLKWAAHSRVPSAGLRFLADTGWLRHFPEIQALIGTPQDPEWHPEGDVFTHTGHCLDALAQQPEWLEADPDSRIVYTLAVLAHDFAKPATTRVALKDGRERIVSPGHEEAGGPLADSFLDRIHAPLALRRRILPLVTHHLAHLQPPSSRSVRRLARRLEPETIRSLCLVIRADQFGRPPKPRVPSEALLALEAKADELQLAASAPRPILKGRHLIGLGMAPGPDIGLITEAAFDAQLDGAFADLDGALAWLLEQPSLPLPTEARLMLARRGSQPR